MKKLLLILIRFVALAFFVGISYAYFSEKDIIKNSQPLPLRIDKLYCSGKSATIIVNKNSEDYNVWITKKACAKLSKGQYINLYYNKRFDYYFMPGHVKPVMVIGALLFFCFTFTFKYLERLEKKLKSTTK